jgi:hypothetical protein
LVPGRDFTQQDRNELLTSEIRKLEVEIKEVATLQEEIAALKARQEAVETSRPIATCRSPAERIGASTARRACT